MEEENEIIEYDGPFSVVEIQRRDPTIAYIVGITLAAGTAIYLGQKAYYKLLARRQAKERIEHETVWLEDRGHEIDVYVLAVCEKLWAEDIETFFSCQGGPTIQKRKTIHIYRAYVSVLKKDSEQVWDILDELGHHPVIDPCHGSDYPDRVAVRFDPSPEALGPSWSLDDVRE